MKKTSHLESHSKIILIGLMVLYSLFLMDFVSATLFDTNIVAYWNMTNSSTVIINDLTNQGFNLIREDYTGQLTYPKRVSGILDYAQKFNRFNDDVSNVNGFNVSRTTTGLENLTRPLTINLWANVSNTNEYSCALSTGYNGLCFMFNGGGAYPDISLGGADSGVGVPSVSCNITMMKNIWAMYSIVLYANNTEAVYINGTKCASGNFADVITTASNTAMVGHDSSSFANNYTLDEIGIWNTSLTENDITTLYNNGLGLPFSSSVLITYNKPTRTQFTNENITFNCSGNGIGSAIYNLTLGFDNIFNYTIQNTTASQNFISLEVGRILSYGNHTYNCSSCIANGVCYSGINNNIFVKPYILDKINFNNITFSRSSESYSLNLTLGTDNLNSAYLWYNNTLYSSTIVNTNSTNYIVSNSLLTPSLSTSANISFWWVLNFNGGQFNTTATEQNVRVVDFDDCSAYTKQIYNFTLKDEETQAILNGSIYNTTIEVNLNLFPYGSTSVSINYSKSFNITNPITICINNNTGNTIYQLDTIVKYLSDNRVERFFYTQKMDFTNSTNITKNLFDLLLTDSTTFIATYTDENGILRKDVVISLLRKYVGEGIFKEVENGKTNNDGETLLHLIQEDIIYKFNVTLNNTILFTSGEYTVYCIAGSECRISLSANPSVPNFPTIQTNYYTILANQTSRYITLNFSMDSSALINFSIYKYSNNQSEITALIGTSSMTASSGSLSIFVPVSYGNTTYLAKVYKNNALIGNHLVFMRENPIVYFGGVWIVFLVAIMILALVLMAVSSGEGVIIFAIIGLVGAVVMNLLIMPYSILIYIVCAGVLLIVKLRTGERA